MGFCGIFIHSELVGSSTFSSNRKFSWMCTKLYPPPPWPTVGCWG